MEAPLAPMMNNELFLQDFNSNSHSNNNSSCEMCIDDTCIFDLPFNSDDTQQKKKRRRQRKRRGNGRNEAMSPSSDSICSLASMITNSSGISSAGSLTLDEMELKSNFSMISPTSSAASCIGLDEERIIPVCEDIDEAFVDCSSSASFTLSDPKELCNEWSTTMLEVPNKLKKNRGKKSRSSLLKNSNLKNDPFLKQYFYQQKLFYRTIYEQQFAALSSSSSSSNTNTKKCGLKKYPHQHLGLPPLAPPSTSSFSNYENFIHEFTNLHGPCEEAFFNKMRQHSVEFRRNLSSFDNFSLQRATTTTTTTNPSMISRVDSISSTSDGASFDSNYSTVPFTHYPRTSPNHQNIQDKLTTNIIAFYDSVIQKEGTLLKKLRLRDLLYYSLVTHFPACGLYIVGSTLNGFGNESSDMDICFVLTNGEVDQKVEAINTLRSIQQILSSLAAIQEQTLIRAKVPILRIKFQGQHKNMIVDLNVNNLVAIRNTHLLYYYAFQDWRVRPLVAVVKEWAKQCDINDASRSSFTSYSLVLMVIHFLQVGVSEPVLPSLQNCCPERFNSFLDIRTLNILSPLEESFDNLTTKNATQLGDLLIGFFYYYAYVYDYEKNAISVRLGHQVERKAVIKDKLQWSPICIEEPFTHTNTAHSIYDERVFQRIKGKFCDAYAALQHARCLDKLITIPSPSSSESDITSECQFSI